jgi:hypothetical protein|tara:strand:- start:212 stop:400 length:189 start_codon:yes stop_codon:yes gene_type:complete
MKNKIKEIIYRYDIDLEDEEDFINELLSLHNVIVTSVCGNCDGYGYTVDENGRRKEHCTKCE